MLSSVSTQPDRAGSIIATNPREESRKEIEMEGTKRVFRSMAVLPLLFCALLAMPASRSAAQTATPQATSTLTVRVTGIRNATGNLRITLSRDANVVDQRTVEIDAKSMTGQAVFENLPQGTYAVSVIHDENKNGKLDFDSMGMPVEGYGASNNPEKRMGPPNPEETTFALKQAPVTTEIKLIYWP
jgi:uncharacterized protein (DUF2141 family)